MTFGCAERPNQLSRVLVSILVEAAEPEAPARPQIVLQTHYQTDPRYSNSNQAKACFVKYSEFHKCAAEEGEDSEKCKSFQRAYRSICPCDWVTRWNELREEGS